MKQEANFRDAFNFIDSMPRSAADFVSPFSIPFDSFSTAYSIEAFQGILTDLLNAGLVKELRPYTTTINSLDATLSQPTAISTPHLVLGNLHYMHKGVNSILSIDQLIYEKELDGSLKFARVRSSSFGSVDATITMSPMILEKITTSADADHQEDQSVYQTIVVSGVLVILTRPFTPTAYNGIPRFLDYESSSPAPVQSQTKRRELSIQPEAANRLSSITSLIGGDLAISDETIFRSSDEIITAPVEDDIASDPQYSIGYPTLVSSIQNPPGTRLPVIKVPRNFYFFLQARFKERFGTYYDGQIPDSIHQQIYGHASAVLLMCIHDAVTKSLMSLSDDPSEFWLFLAGSCSTATQTGRLLGMRVSAAFTHQSAVLGKAQAAIDVIVSKFPTSNQRDTALWMIPPVDGLVSGKSIKVLISTLLLPSQVAISALGVVTPFGSVQDQTYVARYPYPDSNTL